MTRVWGEDAMGRCGCGLIGYSFRRAKKFVSFTNFVVAVRIELLSVGLYYVIFSSLAGKLTR